MVLDPESVKKVFAPIQSRFEGLLFPIPILPDVTNEFKAFVNCIVFEVVFPKLVTSDNRTCTWVFWIATMRPVCDTVN